MRSSVRTAETARGTVSLFLRYLSSKRMTLAAVFLCVLILLCSFRLYRLPAAAVLYPTAVCLLLLFVFLLIGFFREKRRYTLLSRLNACPPELSDLLPAPESLTEEAYCRVLRTLQEENARQAAESDRACREMLDYYTVWAHQIKTPIASMKLSLQSEDSPLARRLSADLFRIGQYVEMVLTYLRLGSDSSDYVFRRYALDDIVRPAVRKFAQEFILRRLRLDCQPLPAVVLTDEKWLSFVVEQVLSNALKYTREGSIFISMRSECVLCIADTGIGIAAEDLPRIFENGFTGCNGRADRTSSGIGLYLCRRVCENLGVGISAESVPGCGTSILLDFSERTEKR